MRTTSNTPGTLTLLPADARGKADHGWLQANFSFSFAGYHDPARMHFGVLRVLNDDIIAAGKGFGTHPHDNMEIITIPLKGALAHKDSMGNSSVIKAGDVQVMSAGSGIQHSEFNPDPHNEANTLQIWLFPNKRNVISRYQQISLDPIKSLNQWQQILSPDPNDEGVWIHQDAWFHIGRFEDGKEASYRIKQEGNGVYAFVLAGSGRINGQALEVRDGLGITATGNLELTAGSEGFQVLLMDVPMQAT